MKNLGFMDFTEFWFLRLRGSMSFSKFGNLDFLDFGVFLCLSKSGDLGFSKLRFSPFPLGFSKTSVILEIRVP